MDDVAQPPGFLAMVSCGWVNSLDSEVTHRPYDDAPYAPRMTLQTLSHRLRISTAAAPTSPGMRRGSRPQSSPGHLGYEVKLTDPTTRRSTIGRPAQCLDHRVSNTILMKNCRRKSRLLPHQ